MGKQTYDGILCFRNVTVIYCTVCMFISELLPLFHILTRYLRTLRVCWNDDETGRVEIWTVKQESARLHTMSVQEWAWRWPCRRSAAVVTFHNLIGNSPSYVRGCKHWQDCQSISSKLFFHKKKKKLCSHCVLPLPHFLHGCIEWDDFLLVHVYNAKFSQSGQMAFKGPHSDTRYSAGRRDVMVHMVWWRSCEYCARAQHSYRYFCKKK